MGSTLCPGLDGGTPQSKTGWVTSPTPVQDWMGCPLSRTGWGTPFPPPQLDGVTPPPYPGLSGIPPFPSRTGWGTSLSRTGWGTPPPIRGGRYAFCVHAGGLSCFNYFIERNLKQSKCNSVFKSYKLVDHLRLNNRCGSNLCKFFIH